MLPSQDKTLHSVTSTSRAPTTGAELERTPLVQSDSFAAGEAALSPGQGPDHAQRSAALAHEAVLEGTDTTAEAETSAPEAPQISEAEAAQAYHGNVIAKVGTQLKEMAGRRKRIFKSRQEKRSEKDAAEILETLSGLDSKTISGVIENLASSHAAELQTLLKAFGVRDVATSYPREVRAVLSALPAAQVASFAKDTVGSSPAAAQLAYEVLPETEQATLLAQFPQIGAAAGLKSGQQNRMDASKAEAKDKELRASEEAYRASLVAAQDTEAKKSEKAAEGAAQASGIVTQVRTEIQGKQFSQALGSLGQVAEEGARISAVQQLEQEGLIVTLLESLTFEQRWNEQPLAIRRVLQARSADANMAHALRYLQKEQTFWNKINKKWGKSDLSAAEAYDALHMLRALSPGHRAQFQRQNPEQYARIEPYLTQSMREADDSNMATTEADQATAAELTAKIKSTEFWGATPALQLEMTLKAALRLGLRHEIAAQLQALSPEALQALHGNAERRNAIEAALGTQEAAAASEGSNEAQAWLGSLVLQQRVSEQGKQLKDSKYVSSSIGALFRANSASRRDAKKAQQEWDEANARGEAVGERPTNGKWIGSQIGGLLSKKKDLEVENLALDEIQGAVDVFGGDIQFKDYGKRKGDNKDEDRNRADLKMNMSKGFMEFKCPHLELTKMRYPLGDMLVDMGPAVMTNAYIRITWPTSHAPEQRSFIEVSSDSIELNDMFVTSPGMLVGIKQLSVQGFKFTNGEQAITLPDEAKLEDALKLVRDQNPARSMVSWGLNFAGFASLDKTKNAAADMESLIAATFTKPQGSMGGMTLSSQDLVVKGITYNSDVYIGEVKVGATNMVWDSRPSVVAGAHLARLDKLIQDGEAALNAGSGAKGLKAQVENWKSEQASLQAKIPTWKAKEDLYQRARQFSILPGAQNEDLQNDILAQAQSLGIQLGEKGDIKTLTSLLEADLSRSAGIAASVDSIAVKDVDAMGMKVGSAEVKNIQAHVSPDLVDAGMAGAGLKGNASLSVGSAKVNDFEGMGVKLKEGSVDNVNVSADLGKEGKASVGLGAADIRGFEGMDMKIGHAQISDVQGQGTIKDMSGGLDNLNASGDVSVGQAQASDFEGMGVSADKIELANAKVNGSVQNGQIDASANLGRIKATNVKMDGTTITEAGIDGVDATLSGNKHSTQVGLKTGSIYGDVSLNGDAQVTGRTSIDGISMDMNANASINDLASGKLPTQTKVTLGVGAINIPKVSYASAGMSVGMDSAYLAPISAQATVHTREVTKSDGSKTQELSSATIDYVRMPEITGTGLDLKMPISGEMLRVTLPSASVKGIALENLSIPGFDAASLQNSTGKLTIASMQTRLSAQLGNSLKANAAINVGQINAEALASGDLKFGLKGLTLSELGFEQNSQTQDGNSIVSQIIKLGGSASRIGKLDLEGRYNTKSGDLSTSITLGEMSLSGLNYRAGGTHLSVGNASLRDVSVSLDAKLNTSGSGDALKSLTLKELKFGRLQGTNISYKGTGKQLQDLGNGQKREVSTEQGVSLKSANISNVRLAGVPLVGAAASRISASIGSGSLEGLSAVMKEDGKNVLQANVSAAVQNIRVDLIGKDLEASIGGFNGSFDATLGNGDTATHIGANGIQVGGNGQATTVRVNDYADADKRSINATVPYIQAKQINFAQGIRGFERGAVGLGSAELRSLNLKSDKDKLVVDIGSGSGKMTGGIQATGNTQLITDKTPDRTETPTQTVEWRALNSSLLNGYMRLNTPGGTPLVRLNFKDNAPKLDLAGSRDLLFEHWKNKLASYASASGIVKLLLDPARPIKDTKLMLIGQMVMGGIELGFNTFSNKMVGLWPTVEQKMLSLLNQDASTKFVKGNDQASVTTLFESMDKLIAGNLGPVVETIVSTGIIYDVVAGEHRRALETAGSWVTEMVGDGLDWAGSKVGIDNVTNMDDRARERRLALQEERRQEIYQFINNRIEDLMTWSLEADLSGTGARYQALSQPNPNPQNKPKSEMLSTGLNLKLYNKTSLRDFRLNGSMNLNNFKYKQGDTSIGIQNMDVGAKATAGVTGELGGKDKLGFKDIGANANADMYVNFQGLRFEQDLRSAQAPTSKPAPAPVQEHTQQALPAPVVAPAPAVSTQVAQPNFGDMIAADYKNRVVQAQNAELYGKFQRQYAAGR